MFYLILVVFQRAGSAYLERYPLKYPKRTASKPGLRPRSHLSVEDRKIFDAYSKQYYWDLVRDVDGNDRFNTVGVLSGTDIPAADLFFNKVYKMMMEKKNENLVASGPPVVTSGPPSAAGSSRAVYGVTGDPNVLFGDTDEEDA